MPWKSDEKTPERPEEILNELDQMIKNAKPIPLTDQVRVDARRLRELHDQLRRSLGLARSS